jgi:hypothetical protein
MADYFTPTTVQQQIPAGLISPFEKLLLAHIFEHEELDEKLYYFASEAPCDFPTLDRTELEAALAASPQKSRLKTFAKQQLDAAPADSPRIDLDFSASPYGNEGHLIILQDIVRRCKDQLPYITVTAAWTCSKMHPDGFGGHAIIITPRAIRSWSTGRYLEAFPTPFEKQQPANTPP